MSFIDYAHIYYYLLVIFYVSFLVHFYPVNLALIQPPPPSASFHSLSPSLSISPSFSSSLSISLSLYLSHSLDFFISIPLYLSLYIHINISISLFFLTSLCFTMFIQPSQFQWIALTIFNPTQ